MRQAPAVPAKISVPRPSDSVVRPRLHRALDRARKGRAVWVTGAAGAGKTTLVAGYLAKKHVPCLWYHADAGDADVASLFYYLGRAVGAHGRRRRRTPLPLLTPEYAGGLAVFTRRYFEALFEALPSGAVMVFDNDQDVAENAAWHEVLAQAVASVPEGSSMIFISRREPPSAFSPAIAQGAMSVVGGEELEFTAREATALVRTRQPMRRLSAREVAHLVKEARGWAAGLILLAGGASLGKRARSARDDVAAQRVFDYFATEVFARLPRQRQKFLLTTAVLPTLTGGIAVALTGASDAGRLLARFNREGFFTQRHAGGEDVFRYHPLFRAFLLERAEATLSLAERVSLRRRAAALLLEQEQFEDAIELLHEAEDGDGLTQIIIRQAPALMGQGRSATLEAWLGKLDPGLVGESHWLIYWRAAAGLARAASDCFEQFERALAGFRALGDRTGIFLSLAGMLQAIAFQGHDFRRIDRIAREVDQARRETGAFPSPIVALQVTTAMLVALTYRRPDGIDVDRWLADALELARVSAAPELKANIYGLALFFFVLPGRISEAANVRALLDDALRAHPPSPPVLSCAKASEAFLLLLTGDLQGADRAADEGLEVCRHHGATGFHSSLLAMKVQRALLAGDAAAASALLETMEKMAKAVGTDYPLGNLHYHLGWAALVAGDFTRAAREVAISAKHTDRLGFDLVDTVTFVARATVQIELGDDADVLERLAAVEAAARRNQYPSVLYVAHLARADYHDRRGEREQACQAVGEALAMARTCGVVMPPWTRPSTVARLCSLALDAGVEVEQARTVIMRLGLPPVEGCTDAWPWAVRIHTLGCFEVERRDDGAAAARLGGTPLRLLEALVGCGGEASQEELSERLWPDAEGDAARRAFDTTLHRLRRLVGDPHALRLADGRLALDRQRCWADVWEVEWIVKQLSRWLDQPEADRTREPLARLTDRLCRLYRGPSFASSRGGQDEARARRLHRETLRALDRAAAYWKRSGDDARARAIERHVLQLANGDPVVSGPARGTSRATSAARA